MNSIKQWLSDYDAGKEVQTVSMGGISYGYEKAIQELAIEIMRKLEDKQVPENNDEFTVVLNDAKEKSASELDSKHGFSGAQVGASANLAAVYWRKTPAIGIEMMQSQDPERIFKIKKGENETILVDYKQ